MNRIVSISHEDIAKGKKSIAIGEHGQTADKKGAQLTAIATTVRVDWVDITDLAHDELPWDGGPEYEFYYFLLMYDTYNQYEPRYLWSYNSVGWTNQTSGSLRFTNNSSNPMTNPVSTGYYYQFPKAAEFDYYEDDGADWFDDYQGYHIIYSFTPTGSYLDFRYNTGTVVKGQDGKIVQAQYTFY